MAQKKTGKGKNKKVVKKSGGITSSKWKNRVKTWSGNKETREKHKTRNTQPTHPKPKKATGKTSSSGRDLDPTENYPKITELAKPLKHKQVESLAEQKKKRVSFSSNLSESTTLGEIDENLADTETPKFKSDEDTPSKSILKRKIPGTKPKLDFNVDQPTTAEPMDVETEPSPSVNKKSRTGDRNVEPLPAGRDLEPFKISKGGIAKKKPSLQVSRSIKEKLLTMERKERKEFIKTLKEKRKPYSDIAKSAKQIWEKLRSGKTSKADKERCVLELRELVKGNVKKLIYAHDTVRVIECMMALNRADVRNELFEEVKEDVIKMSKSKYARFFLQKMLRNGSKEQRGIIMKSFHGTVPDLMRHNYASEIVELAYNDYADAVQRSQIVSEFYGPEFAKIKVNEVRTLQEILSEKAERKPFVLRSLREFLAAIVDKPALKHSLTHRVLHDYFTICGSEDRQEIIDALKERAMEIVHTREGCRVAMSCVWHGSAKERKVLMKATKDLIPKMAKEEHGHMLLLAIFDTIDDTVLLQKTVLKEIAQHLDDIVKDKYGQKVILYLLNPRDQRFFLKETIAVLAEGDDNEFSKKPKETRHRELLESIAVTLLKYVRSNMSDLIFKHDRALLVLQSLVFTAGAVLTGSRRDDILEARKECFEALAEVASEEFVPGDLENRLHIVEHKQGNFILGVLLKKDKELVAKGLKSLSEVFAEKIDFEALCTWTGCNKGTFVLLHMLESGSPQAAEVVKRVTGRESKKLNGYSFASASLLIKKCSS